MVLQNRFDALELTILQQDRRQIELRIPMDRGAFANALQVLDGLRQLLLLQVAETGQMERLGMVWFEPQQPADCTASPGGIGVLQIRSRLFQ